MKALYAKGFDMELPVLTARQTRFVAEYCALGNGSEAARRAGYSHRTARAMATENLTKPAIQAAVAVRKAEYTAALEITKDDVVGGILAAINVARDKGDAGAMIRGCVELARLMGFYDLPADKTAVSANGAAMLARLTGLSDEALISLAAGCPLETAGL